MAESTTTATSRDVRMRGTISSCGFDSGDRIVVGAWWDSPFGEFADVMWARPDGEKVLLAPSTTIAEFVSSIYDFDVIRIANFSTNASVSELSLTAGPIDLHLWASGGMRLPARPFWLTRFVERPIAERVMDVTTHGTSPSGVEEWYQARAWRWVRSGYGKIDGADLGEMRPVDPPVGVGFSEPPTRPSIVDVAVRLRYPPGHEKRDVRWTVT